MNDVALIKIDVEAAEASVVEGLRETVAKSRPTLVIEIHHGPPHDRRCARSVLPILFDSQYTISDVDNDPELTRPLRSPSDWSGHHHCVAVGHT